MTSSKRRAAALAAAVLVVALTATAGLASSSSHKSARAGGDITVWLSGTYSGATPGTTYRKWVDSIAVMQTGVFYCMRAAARILVPQGSGCVVNISSIRGFSPNAGRMTYCTPKAAVIMMTKVAAGEWAPHGVRINAIAPGVLRTPMWDADVARGAIDEQFYLDVVPMHRLGLPAEVGKLAVYLCSDDAAYVTGAVFTIDGALTSIPAG